MMQKAPLTIIGRTATVAFPEDGIVSIPAKIDTGADSSSVWASRVFIDEKSRLHYTLLADSHTHYNGVQNVTSQYGVKLVRSSNGQSQIRYSVRLVIKIGGRRIRTTFTLADRSHNSFPVLMGCKLLKGKFVVDVSRGVYKDDLKNVSANLGKELKKDPHAFYKKYHAVDNEGKQLL